MKVSLHPCFILHHRAYRESSLILEVFSRKHGRLSLIAKGAKRRKANSHHIMQPNRRLNIAWSIRGDMGTLTSIEANGIAFSLSSRKLISAFYLNELLMRLLHRHEAHPELFDAYDKALSQLANGTEEQILLRLFEKRLLESLGYGLILDHDVNTGDLIDPDTDYYYLIDQGPSSRSPGNTEHIKISGATLQALETEELKEQTHLAEIKQLMQLSLKSHLGSKSLESRKLYRAYMNNKNSGTRSQKNFET